MTTVYRGPALGRLLSRLFPLRQSLAEGQSLAELKGKYMKWERINALEFLALAAVSVYGTHSVLVSYAPKLVRDDPASIYTLRAISEFWYFPALLLGCVAAGVAVHLLNHAIFPDGAREFRIYSNVSAGCNASGMFAAIGIVVFAFGALLSYFAASNAVRLHQNDMVIHHLWSFRDESHAYSEITALKEIRGPQNNRDDFEIDFQQAEPWTTEVEEVFFEPAQKKFLEQHSGKAIQQLIGE